MIDFELRKQMECTEEEKLECLPVINKIMEYVNIARDQGLLSLEEHIPGIDDNFLKAGMQVMVDGLSPEYTFSILNKMIMASNKTGVDLIKQLIIRDGILAMQAGEAPGPVLLQLHAYLGEDVVIGLLEGIKESREKYDSDDQASDELSNDELSALLFDESDQT